MKTFTIGTTPEEVILEALPHKYKMELNKNDMMHLLQLLYDAYCILEPTDDPETDDWPLLMRTSILQTIGIEEI